jgi:hypothetical protein
LSWLTKNCGPYKNASPYPSVVNEELKSLLAQSHVITVTSDLKTSPPSVDFPTRSEHTFPLGDSLVNTPNPDDELAKSNDSNESANPGGAVVVVDAADDAG